MISVSVGVDLPSLVTRLGLTLLAASPRMLPLGTGITGVDCVAHQNCKEGLYCDGWVVSAPSLSFRLAATATKDPAGPWLAATLWLVATFLSPCSSRTPCESSACSPDHHWRPQVQPVLPLRGLLRVRGSSRRRPVPQRLPGHVQGVPVQPSLQRRRLL